jgi:hypothetical protein
MAKTQTDPIMRDHALALRVLSPVQGLVDIAMSVINGNVPPKQEAKVAELAKRCDKLRADVEKLRKEL